MSPKPYDCAQDRLDSIFENSKYCGWCQYPFKKLHRAGLCRHCYSIKTELKQRYRNYLIEKARSKTWHDMFISEYELRVAIKMAESAQIEGRSYGELNKRDVSNLDLEHEFGYLSRMVLRRDLYEHGAHLFECFSQSQKRYLLYIIARMLRDFNRRHYCPANE